MKPYLLSLGKSYLKNYYDLSMKCWRGIIISFLESLLIGVFYFLPIYFVSDIHLNIALAGRIISCYGVGAIIGGYVSGKLSDKIPPEKVSASSLLIQSLGYFLLTEIKAINLLSIVIFILGIATYGFITANYLCVLKQCHNESQRLKAINWLSTASNLGLGISAIFVSYLVSYGFQNIFIIVSILLMPLSIYLFCQEDGRRLSDIDFEKKQILIQKEIKEKKIEFIFWLVLIWVLFVGCIVSQMSSTYSLYIKNIFPQLGLKAIGILFTINSFLVVLFEVPLGSLLGKYNKISMVGLGGFFIGLGMFLLIFASTLSIAILACMIYTFGEIIFFSMSQFVCFEKGAEKTKGHSMGMFRTVYASSRVIGPASGGFIFHQLNADILWIICGIIGTLCLLSCHYCKIYD